MPILSEKNIITFILSERNLYPMDSIKPISLNLPMNYRPVSSQIRDVKVDGFSTVSQIEKVTASQKQEIDLTLVTQDEDVVTISSDSESRLDFTIYDQTGRLRGLNYPLQSKVLSVESSQELMISVQGELNHQEIQDIQDVLKSLDKVIDDFLKRKPGQVVTRTGMLGNLDSLSSIEANLQVEQTVFSENITLAETSSSFPSVREPEGNKFSQGANTLDIAEQRIMNIFHEKELSSDKLSRMIEKFFSKLSRVLSKIGHLDLVKEGIPNRLSTIFKKS
jgi:hypothetical protein